ncbi:hypothetical protein SGFS_006480 [Streptomyces graminofaciens]|uniref:Integral membrane protein n=2 Tax=Streptomyces graminofaciens TaxID=68212 RepID=A0ABM7F0V2_9ACTN|nr:hypothetical protein [Streptomyces graminofaciens]BBC29354.1 hypothetical protein SGFS_006480 [Streptomyces graminofaciens]
MTTGVMQDIPEETPLVNMGQPLEFQASCGHLLAVPSYRVGQDVRCPHCHRVVPVPPPEVPYASAVPVPAGAPEPAALNVLYAILLLGGLAGAALIYLVLFNELSESQLVTYTPLWFFPVVFGLYGFVSQRLLRLLAAGRARTLSEAAHMSIGVGGFWAALAMFPFLVLKWRSSLLVSMVAALFWAVLLWLFFALVFPVL